MWDLAVIGWGLMGGKIELKPSIKLLCMDFYT
jgi:hypothetical protein